MALSNNAQLGLGAAAAVAIAVGLVMFVGPKPVPEPAVVVAIPQSVAPALDTLRVEPDGATVIAGRAAPFAVVDILLNGTPVAQVDADASGGFVGFIQLEYGDASRAISLLADNVPSDETYLIAPLPAPVLASEADIAPDEPAQKPTIIVASDEGVRVVQSSAVDQLSEDLSSVALDSITYDPSGDVLIAGRASGEGRVQIYIDNQPVTNSRIAQDGDWRVELPALETGIYTLRIDEVDDAGAVSSRIETPFQREDPSVVARAMAPQTQADAFQVAMTTVQPGTTLWAIAQDRFGDGILYVKVFEANRDRIRDPDLIYPGQVFRIPQDDR